MFRKNILEIENHIITLLKDNYPEHNISRGYFTLLHEGQFANATVFRYNDENLDITIKDFSGSPWIVRNTFGRFFIKTEGKSMLSLNGNPSVSSHVKFLSPYTVAFSFIRGKALKQCPEHSISKEFFINLENNIKEMHKKDIVHLDLRNLGNIIMGKDGYPYIIDFQSCISTKHFPKKLKELLRKVDISGAYKCWKNSCVEPLDPTREKFLEDFNNKRKFWILRGYPIQRFIKKIKQNFNKEF